MCVCVHAPKQNLTRFGEIIFVNESMNQNYTLYYFFRKSEFCGEMLELSGWRLLLKLLSLYLWYKMVIGKNQFFFFHLP